VSPQPSLHPVQITEIRVTAVRVSRRRRGAADAQGPKASVSRPKVVDRAEDGTSFTIEVTARASIPLSEDETWAASLSLQAMFVRDEPVPADLAADFARLSGLWVVWPYARLHMSQLVEMCGIAAPPLPLLTRSQGGNVLPVIDKR
jgi:hypothetical protein